MAALLGAWCKSHWRGSTSQHLIPTETLSCPGTGSGPQTAVQDALCQPLPQRGWTGLPGQGLESGQWNWEKKGAWKEEGRQELPSCKALPGEEGLFFFLAH